MGRYDLDGIHLRMRAPLTACGSALHGCPQPDSDAARCNLTDSRALLMRLRTLVHEAAPSGRLTAEFENGVPPVAASFVDGLVFDSIDADGEPLTVAEVLARGSTAIGPAGEVALPGPDAEDPVSEALGLALLSGLSPRPGVIGAGLSATSSAWSAMEQFDVETANWRPWWADDLPVSADSPDVLVSGWWRDGEVLAVVANRGEADPVVELTVDRKRTELGTWLWAVDAMAGRRVPQIGEVVRMRMEPGQTALVHVRTRHERDLEIDE
jgi:hypothetical protein